ncbi:sulfatase [Paenibacillus peoriae]|uniref:sulfatase family protein n=1 Tax=Paenibacillus peoriae TaxID=59893 RepID=UPI00026C6156|nr:sulfatase [Paenibacillus peoriae]MEC0184822.1 sulfatase [Paenibacillus peoriae]
MKKQPNIVFMISHDTGRYLSCYGNQVPTPQLDDLAKKGVRFDQYYCSAPQCSPSRGSILTGKYAHNNGLIGLAHLKFNIQEGETTLPIEMEKAGYETALIGFSHETIGDTEKGVYSSTHKLGYQFYEGVEGSRAPQVAEKSIQYLREKAADPDGKPFFVNIGFWETHRSFDEYDNIKDNPETLKVLAYLPDTPNVRLDLAQFHGSVKVLDEAVGSIVNVLKETNLLENTIVVYTTDHGIAFPRAKGTMKDAGLETSLLMFGPNFMQGDRVIDDLLCNIDIMPTLLELAGAKIPTDVDGKSFASRLMGDSGPVREEFFCELTWHDKYHPMRGIRTSRYKYVKNFIDGPKIYMPVDIHLSLSGPDVREQFYVPNEPEELYDLSTDPLEYTNLIHDPAYANIAAELRDKVEEWMNTTDDPLLQGPVEGIESAKWAVEAQNGRAYIPKRS